MTSKKTRPPEAGFRFFVNKVPTDQDGRLLEPELNCPVWVCADCGKPITGERRVCGLCAARRSDETTRASNRARRAAEKARRESLRRALSRTIPDTPGQGAK